MPPLQPKPIRKPSPDRFIAGPSLPLREIPRIGSEGIEIGSIAWSLYFPNRRKEKHAIHGSDRRVRPSGADPPRSWPKPRTIDGWALIGWGFFSLHSTPGFGKFQDLWIRDRDRTAVQTFNQSQGFGFYTEAFLLKFDFGVFRSEDIPRWDFHIWHDHVFSTFCPVSSSYTAYLGAHLARLEGFAFNLLFP